MNKREQIECFDLASYKKKMDEESLARRTYGLDRLSQKIKEMEKTNNGKDRNN